MNILTEQWKQALPLPFQPSLLDRLTLALRRALTLPADRLISDPDQAHLVSLYHLSQSWASGLGEALADCAPRNNAALAEVVSAAAALQRELVTLEGDQSLMGPDQLAHIKGSGESLRNCIYNHVDDLPIVGGGLEGWGRLIAISEDIHHHLNA